MEFMLLLAASIVSCMMVIGNMYYTRQLGITVKRLHRLLDGKVIDITVKNTFGDKVREESKLGWDKNWGEH